MLYEPTSLMTTTLKSELTLNRSNLSPPTTQTPSVENLLLSMISMLALILGIALCEKIRSMFLKYTRRSPGSSLPETLPLTEINLPPTPRARGWMSPTLAHLWPYRNPEIAYSTCSEDPPDRSFDSETPASYYGREDETDNSISEKKKRGGWGGLPPMCVSRLTSIGGSGVSPDKGGLGACPHGKVNGGSRGGLPPLVKRHSV